ncbi:hypothetical protein N0V85_006196 [Neurospora sp. IMI 360204]|nr:hypothetical protein N0V85_006196 [Neurospora sp. IMI 360204]
MPPSSDDEIPINGRGPHTFDLNRVESRRRATFGRVAGGTSTKEPQPRPEIIPIQRGPEPSGSASSPASSSSPTATATATASFSTTSSASNHEKSFKEQQRRRLLYLQETRQQNQQNQPQQKRQTQTLGTHPLSKSFTANAKDREVHCLDTPPPSSHISSGSLSEPTAQSAASILQQQVQGEHQQSQRSQQQSQQSQQQQSQQEHHQQESRQSQQQPQQTQQSQQPQQEQQQEQHQDDNEIAIREESLELLESLTSIPTSNDMNRGSGGGGGGAFGRTDRDNVINNSNNSNKRRAEIDLERPTARRLFTGNITPGHMSGSGLMSGSIFGQSGSGVGPYSPVPGASAPQTPTHPASFDVREGPSGVGGGAGSGESPFPPFSPMALVPFAQPRTPGTVTIAPQRGQAPPERGERAGSVASVTSITSRNGPPMVNPSLPNLPPDGTNWLTGRIVVVSVGAERRKWNVHEQLLSYNSPYFKRLFNPEPEPVEGSLSSPGCNNDHHHHPNPAAGGGGVGEDALPPSEPIQEVHLPTTEPKLFALLIRWLYGTAFATSGGQKVFKFPPPQLNQVTVRDYLGLYILGQTVQLPGLRNACIDVLYNYYAAETEEVRVPDLHDVQYVFENTAHAPDSQMRRLLVAHCMFHLYGVKRRGPLPPDWQEVMEPRCDVAYEMFKMLADWKWVIGENVPTMKIKARHAFHEKPRPEELLPWHKAQTQEEAGMPLVGVVKAEPVDDE